VTDATGASVSFTPADGPADVPVKVTVSDGSLSTSDTAVVHVTNVAPTATFTAPSSVTVLQPINLALTGATDASAVDVAAGLQFRFDCGSGYGAWSSSSTASCPTTDTGPVTVRGAVRDKDGGITEYTATVNVTVTVADVCALVSGWAKNAGQANSLCVKLRNGQIEAFGHEVDAQTGKAFTAEQAALLKRLAGRL
jgi:hypothetical protein